MTEPLKLAIAFGASVLLAAVPAAATAGAACPVTDKDFLRQITANNDWPAVYSVFQHNLPACQDDGLYADGYTNMVVNSLATHWSELDVLENLLVRDAGFKKFIFRHIGAVAAEADLRHVVQSAKAGCPAKSRRLCDDLAARAKAAIDRPDSGERGGR